MRLKLLRCGICQEFHAADRHCGYCGSYRMVLAQNPLTVKYYNWVSNREVVRGIPTDVTRVLERVVERAINIDNANKTAKHVAEVARTKEGIERARIWREEQRRALGL